MPVTDIEFERSARIDLAAARKAIEDVDYATIERNDEDFEWLIDEEAIEADSQEGWEAAYLEAAKEILRSDLEAVSGWIDDPSSAPDVYDANGEMVAPGLQVTGDRIIVAGLAPGEVSDPARALLTPYQRASRLSLVGALGGEAGL